MGSLVRKGGVCIAGQVLQGYTGADNRRRYRSARCEVGQATEAGSQAQALEAICTLQICSRSPSSTFFCFALVTCTLHALLSHPSRPSLLQEVASLETRLQGMARLLRSEGGNGGGGGGGGGGGRRRPTAVSGSGADPQTPSSAPLPPQQLTPPNVRPALPNLCTP